MYKKKKRSSNVNKEEIVGETFMRVVEMLRGAGVAIPPEIGSNPSTHQGRKSSCGEVEQRTPGPSPEPDTIDGLMELTVCSLLDSNYNMVLWCNLLLCGAIRGTSIYLSMLVMRSQPLVKLVFIGYSGQGQVS
jgi:hypothetical protein